jgi:tetratricopeptide (TPR) repeat protein
VKGIYSFFLFPLIFAPGTASQTAQGKTAPEGEQRWRMENDAGRSALDQGRYPDAVHSFQSAIREADERGWTNEKQAESLRGLAQAYFRLGNYTAAERYFREALHILEKTPASDDPNLATLLSSLATVYRIRENYAAAAPLARRSLAILEGTYGPEHPNVAIALNDLAVILRLQRNYDEARLLFQRSLSILEKALGAEHFNVGVALNNLVITHRLQGHHLDAEPLARRSLAIFERAPGRQSSDLLQSLDNLAGICLEVGRYDESEQLYRRALSTRWGAGADGVVLILEKLADVLNLAEFDQPRKKATQAFEGTPGWDAAGVDLYILIGQTLRARGLLPEAEDVLARGVQAFPKSLEARYELANGYSLAQRWASALQTLEEATRIEASGNPAVDGPGRSVIYQEIGRINVLLVQFEDAQSAYKTSLEFDPANFRARVAQGELFLQLDRPDDAATEYARAIRLSGGNAPAYYGTAKLNLRVSRFAEAIAAADKALEIDSRDAKSSYVRAVALLRSNSATEGEAELERFRKLEGEERDKVDRLRAIRVFLRSAADSLASGRGDDAIKQLRAGIRVYPDAGLLHLNLGIIQSQLGRHDDAVETFQSMINAGMGDFFLVHLNLSREYQVLGNKTLSRRHQLIYLQKYYSAFPNGLR